MTNALLVVQVLSGLLSVVTRASALAARATTVIMTARSQGRDVSDDELADLAGESERIGDETLAMLRQAAKR